MPRALLPLRLTAEVTWHRACPATVSIRMTLHEAVLSCPTLAMSPLKACPGTLVSMPSITTSFVPRDNLNQWEKVIRGEETAMWISGPAASKSTSEKLNVKVDD